MEEPLERITLDRNLPVLLDPNDEVSIDDLEALVDEVTSGSYTDPELNKRLHEVGELVKEFQKQKFSELKTPNSS